MVWKVAQAKQRFSEVLRASSLEPQIIARREQPVAALVSMKDFAEFSRWREQQAQGNLGEAFAELREICLEEGYRLPLSKRADRPNSFLSAADDDT